jgi:hypothetical protein
MQNRFALNCPILCNLPQNFSDFPPPRYGKYAPKTANPLTARDNYAINLPLEERGLYNVLLWSPVLSFLPAVCQHLRLVPCFRQLYGIVIRHVHLQATHPVPTSALQRSQNSCQTFWLSSSEIRHMCKSAMFFAFLVSASLFALSDSATLFYVKFQAFCILWAY